MSETSLDDRFAELRSAVDAEIARSRAELITQLSEAIARMRAAATYPEWQETVMESGRAFANEPKVLDLLGVLAALTAPKAPAVQAGEGSGQRFARVKVAEILLYHRDRVTRGRASRDLYGCLKQEIEKAREEYRGKFAGAADYLHSEILHALANGDSTLLGPNYPGPLG